MQPFRLSSTICWRDCNFSCIYFWLLWVLCVFCFVLAFSAYWVLFAWGFLVCFDFCCLLLLFETEEAKEHKIGWVGRGEGSVRSWGRRKNIIKTYHNEKIKYKEMNKRFWYHWKVIIWDWDLSGRGLMVKNLPNTHILNFTSLHLCRQCSNNYPVAPCESGLASKWDSFGTAEFSWVLFCSSHTAC